MGYPGNHGVGADIDPLPGFPSFLPPLVTVGVRKRRLTSQGWTNHWLHLGLLLQSPFTTRVLGPVCGSNSHFWGEAESFVIWESESSWSEHETDLKLKLVWSEYHETFTGALPVHVDRAVLLPLHWSSHQHVLRASPLWKRHPPHSLCVSLDILDITEDFTVVFRIQDVCLVFSLIIVFLSFFSTYVFQVTYPILFELIALICITMFFSGGPDRFVGGPVPPAHPGGDRLPVHLDRLPRLLPQHKMVSVLIIFNILILTYIFIPSTQYGDTASLPA